MSTTDLEITKAYPAVEYNATESAGVYREDREIDGAMWRTYNASFNGSIWSYMTIGISVAYALVQRPDGSISFKTFSGATTGWGPNDWTGSGNYTVFNAADFGLTTSGGTPALNAAAIQNALTAAATLGTGGRILIPAGVFAIDTTSLVNSAITVPTTNPAGAAIGIVIEGSTMGSELAQQAGTLNIFYITGDNSSKAVLIKNLRFSYSSPNASVSPQPYAVYSLSPNVICELCYFADCPGTMYMGGNHNGLLACEINYEVNGSTDTDNAVMVYVTGADDFITECRISQQPVSNNPAGPTGCIAIQVGTADEPRFSNINISDFDYGIDIPGGGTNLVHAMFSNVSCECNVHALRIMPISSTGTVCQVFFLNCDFARAQHAANQSAGVYISTYSGEASNNVSDILFANCLVHDWDGPGVQIVAGQDIVFTGCRFGSNATGASMGTSGGVAVTGPALRVLIVGGDFSGKIPSYMSQPSGGTQPYAISLSAAVSEMSVNGCILSNNASGPLYVASGITPDLQITASRGYNDQGTAVTTTAPSGTFGGATFGYYGPVTFYALGASGITLGISGHIAPFISGTFTLAAGEVATVTIAIGGHTWTNFLMVGQ